MHTTACMRLGVPDALALACVMALNDSDSPPMHPSTVLQLAQDLARHKQFFPHSHIYCGSINNLINRCVSTIRAHIDQMDMEQYEAQSVVGGVAALHRLLGWNSWDYKDLLSRFIDRGLRNGSTRARDRFRAVMVHACTQHRAWLGNKSMGTALGLLVSGRSSRHLCSSISATDYVRIVLAGIRANTFSNLSPEQHQQRVGGEEEQACSRGGRGPGEN